MTGIFGEMVLFDDPSPEFEVRCEVTDMVSNPCYNRKLLLSFETRKCECAYHKSDWNYDRERAPPIRNLNYDHPFLHCALCIFQCAFWQAAPQ
jgi:hypothetical protein